MIDQPMLLLWATGTCHNLETGQSTELEEAKKRKIILFFKNVKNNFEYLEFEKITDMCEVSPGRG